MGIAPSMLTLYDIEEVQKYCNTLFSQQEIVALYHRFCQLDLNAKGFISADEFLSVPEFAMGPFSQEFVAFLSAFSAKTSPQQKIEHSNGKVSLKDMVEVLKDLSGPFISDQQREQAVSQLLREAGYSTRSYLTFHDFVKVLGHYNLKMNVEVPVE